MFNNYGIEIAKLFKKAEELQKQLKHPYVGSEHLMLGMMSYDNEVSNCLEKYNVTYEIFMKELKKTLKNNSNENYELSLYTPLLKRIIASATTDAKMANQKKVSEKDLFLAILEEGEGIAIRVLLSLEVDLDSIYEQLKLNDSLKKEKLEIFAIGKNVNESIKDNEVIIGRDEEISSIIEVLLRKKKNNPLLIGKAGVGKTAIIEELARRINKNLVPWELRNKTIVSLEMASVVAGTKYRGEFEEKLNKIINEVINNKDIILFIDEIHTMINAGGAEGAINASDILKPYLARGDIFLIGATTLDEYYKTINKDKALDRRFFSILVEEPNTDETIKILNGIKYEYEEHYQIKITKDNIKDIVLLADKYIKNKNNPDKAIDLLEIVCAHKKIQNTSYKEIEKLEEKLKKVHKDKIKAIEKNDYNKAIELKEQENLLNIEKQKIINNKGDYITKEDIIEVIAKKTNIPLLEDKLSIFKTIKNNLDKNIIGQKNAKEVILKNIWYKLNNDYKPLSLFLNGPSGVGKTEVVKQIAKSFKKINFIRLDMSEYNLETSVNKLIGVSAGYVGYDDDYIFRSVIDNPYAIILIDEIEKASRRVLNLFLQILDEGFITNAKGEKIDFSHTMIFATSNAININSVGFINQFKKTLQEVFSKEFLGRFQDIVTFNKLSDDVLKEYTKKNLTNKNIDFETLKKEAECDDYGLRNLKNLIKKYNCEIDIEIPL